MNASADCQLGGVGVLGPRASKAVAMRVRSANWSWDMVGSSKVLKRVQGIGFRALMLGCVVSYAVLHE